MLSSVLFLYSFELLSCYAIHFLNFDPKKQDFIAIFGLKQEIKPWQSIQYHKIVLKPLISGTYSNKHNTILPPLWLFPTLRQIQIREYLFRRNRHKIIFLGFSWKENSTRVNQRSVFYWKDTNGTSIIYAKSQENTLSSLKNLHH